MKSILYRSRCGTSIHKPDKRLDALRAVLAHGRCAGDFIRFRINDHFDEAGRWLSCPTARPATVCHAPQTDLALLLETMRWHVVARAASAGRSHGEQAFISTFEGIAASVSLLESSGETIAWP